MCILALLKLRNIESFSNMFLGYDLLMIAGAAVAGDPPGAVQRRRRRGLRIQGVLYR